MLQNLEDADLNLKNSRLSVFLGVKVWTSSTSHEDHTMTIANKTNSQGKCHVFIKMMAKMRKLIKVKMMYPWSSNITQMTIKMKMNQYKDDIHQDEDDDHQTQRWIANKTYQSRDRWRSLREFGRPAFDSLPRGWSRWPAMVLDHDQDAIFQNAI